MGSTPLWVFGYGSLMWNPGFAHDTRAIARLSGYARTFCMRSIHHRGTPEHPGLVLALDSVAGAACDGLVFRVTPGNEAQTLDDLRKRELISSAYLEKTLPVDIVNGVCVRAMTFVVDAEHVQYCGGLSLAEQADVIASAVGGRGANTDYLYSTTEHLAELGISDPDLEWLSQRVRKIAQIASE
ncbi:MAG: gamma-glutamylcyclotransferase [Paracoccaceae bacterium]